MRGFSAICLMISKLFSATCLNLQFLQTILASAWFLLVETGIVRLTFNVYLHNIVSHGGKHNDTSLKGRQLYGGMKYTYGEGSSRSDGSMVIATCPKEARFAHAVHKSQGDLQV